MLEYKTKIKTFLDHEISFNTKISKVIKVLIPTALIYTAFNSFTNIKVLEQMAEDGGVGGTPLYLHVANFIMAYPEKGWGSLAVSTSLDWFYLPLLTMAVSLLFTGVFIGYFIKK